MRCAEGRRPRCRERLDAVNVEKALVSAQIALSLVLVFGASLFVRSFAALATLDPGFNASAIVQAGANLARADIPQARRLLVYDQLATSLRAIPGVESVACVQISARARRHAEQPREGGRIHADGWAGHPAPLEPRRRRLFPGDADALLRGARLQRTRYGACASRRDHQPGSHVQLLSWREPDRPPHQRRSRTRRMGSADRSRRCPQHRLPDPA